MQTNSVYCIGWPTSWDTAERQYRKSLYSMPPAAPSTKLGIRYTTLWHLVKGMDRYKFNPSYRVCELASFDGPITHEIQIVELIKSFVKDAEAAVRESVPNLPNTHRAVRDLLYSTGNKWDTVNIAYILDARNQLKSVKPNYFLALTNTLFGMSKLNFDGITVFANQLEDALCHVK